jgi:hypothetical protein
MREYEFHVYSATPEGDVSALPVELMQMTCTSEGTAKAVARKLARQHQAPVDVARVGPTPWADRVVGTAVPMYPYTACKKTEWEPA